MWQFLTELVSKGRIVQWIMGVGGFATCICGGFGGFLDGDDIRFIVLALVAAGFGIETLMNKQKAKEG